jgi:hypothetical protein
MESEISMKTPDVRIPILSCGECDRYWRAEQPERCIYCARDYGSFSQEIDLIRRRQLFEAVRTIPLDVVLIDGDMRPFYKNQSYFEAELLDYCPWYRSSDPQCTQACWFALQEICPWAHINPRAQALWDDFLGEKPDVTVTESQLRYASLFFELDFQDCVHLAEQLDEDPQAKWAAYCDAHPDEVASWFEEDDKVATYLEDQIELHGI